METCTEDNGDPIEDVASESTSPNKATLTKDGGDKTSSLNKETCR